jgi:pyruvyltransferase
MTNNIKFYWFNSEPNFGDYLGPYIYNKLTGGKQTTLIDYTKETSTYYLTVGSIMWAAKKNSIIWGTGIIRKDNTFDKPLKVLLVRGPLTRKRFLELGYECPEIYGDPALLLPKLYTPPPTKSYNLGIIPHIYDYNSIKNKYNTSFVIDLNIPISVQNIENIINKITSCSYTISSSLHGIIVSHAYQIPCLWVKFSDKLYGDSVKFYDYYLSIGISNPTYLDLSSKKYSDLELIDLIKTAPQPIFPIPNDNIWNTCPFIKH